MTYSAIDGRWISDQQMVWSRDVDATLPVDGAEDTIGVFMLPSYAAYVNAGLTPQFRLFGSAYNTYGPLSNSIETRHYDISLGQMDERYVGSGGAFACGQQTVKQGFDTGWRTIVNPSGPKAILQSIVVVGTVNAANPADAIIIYPSVQLRWIST